MTRTRFIGTLIVSAFIILVAVSSLRQKASLSTGSEQMPGKAVAYDSYAPTEAPSYGASNRALVGNIVAPQSYGGGATEVTASNRLVVRTGYLSLVVQDVSWTIEQMTAYIVGKGGFVANSTLEKTAVAPVGSLTVRVAAKEYDATLQKMKEFGEVISQTTNGQDITEEYVDLDSRLKNLQATEEQLLAIMKRAGKISEVLSG